MRYKYVCFFLAVAVNLQGCMFVFVVFFFFCQLCCLQWLHFVCQSATALRDEQTHIQKKNRKSKSTDLKKDSKKKIE